MLIRHPALKAMKFAHENQRLIEPYLKEVRGRKRRKVSGTVASFPFNGNAYPRNGVVL
jgi:hypothetical protein